MLIRRYNSKSRDEGTGTRKTTLPEKQSGNTHTHTLPRAPLSRRAVYKLGLHTLLFISVNSL